MNIILSYKKTSYLQEEFFIKRKYLKSLTVSLEEFHDCSVSVVQLAKMESEIYAPTAKSRLMVKQGNLGNGKKNMV